ncbi:MAG TPA: type 1 glutamine amidotransferase [Acidimicrobiales bacterium]
MTESVEPARTGTDPRPWAFIQHVAHEGPGLIGEVLAAAGHEYAVARMDLDEDLPDAGRIGGLVVLGGPMGVHDADRFPWLDDERRLLATAAGSGLPVLGVCLGAQQLAAALGADVTTGHNPEYGVGTVTLTASGRRDRMFGPEYGGLADTDIPCVHWHRDTFGLPPGSVHLAATRAYPHQAFRVGARAYGLQFHVEVTTALGDGWRKFLPDGVVLEPSDLSRVETTGRRILQRFVDLAGTS